MFVPCQKIFSMNLVTIIFLVRNKNNGNLNSDLKQKYYENKIPKKEITVKSQVGIR